MKKKSPVKKSVFVKKHQNTFQLGITLKFTEGEKGQDCSSDVKMVGALTTEQSLIAARVLTEVLSEVQASIIKKVSSTVESTLPKFAKAFFQEMRRASVDPAKKGSGV